jgi:predicted amidohydrolase YtcJ
VAAARTEADLALVRHQITHLHLVSDADLPRFAQLAVIANIQPSFATNISWNTDRALELIGPKRHATMFRFRDMLAAGAELAGGTDTPVVTADQLVTVETAVTRQEPGRPGKPFPPKAKTYTSGGDKAGHSQRRESEFSGSRERVHNCGEVGRFRNARQEYHECASTGNSSSSNSLDGD